MVTTFEKYQEEAMKTSAVLSYHNMLTVAALGICGESGETAELVKKHIGQGHALGVEKLKEELGDIMWYIALMCDALGLKMSDIATSNIKKLSERYPNGFEKHRSINREGE